MEGLYEYNDKYRSIDSVFLSSLALPSLDAPYSPQAARQDSEAQYAAHLGVRGMGCIHCLPRGYPQIYCYSCRLAIGLSLVQSGCGTAILV